jgi:streptogramin lyase
MRKSRSPAVWSFLVKAALLTLWVGAFASSAPTIQAAVSVPTAPQPPIAGGPPETPNGTVCKQDTYTPTAYLPVVCSEFDPTQPPATETRIVIDGQADDWSDRPTLFTDPIGDAEDDCLDLTAGSAFVNRNALYLLVETVDENATVVQFDMVFQADTQTLLVSWAPGQSNGYIGDVTDGYQPIGPTSDSAFAFGPALEGRVDLRDLGSPESVSIIQINVMVGECCDHPAWRAADEWAPTGETPEVNEYDHPRWASPLTRYVLARRYHLPLWDWVAERLFTPPAPDLGSIGRSENGVVYLHHAGLNVGLSTLDPISGTVAHILDLPPEGDTRVVGGPGDTAFVTVGNEIWQVDPDGAYSVWGQAPAGTLFTYTADGDMLGSSHNRTQVLNFAADGSSELIAGGFSDINDIVAATDGTVFVSDWEEGSITRVDTDSSQHLLVEDVLYRDPMDMDVDPDGNLFLNTVATGLVQVDRSTGAFTTYESAHTPCTIHPADFVFTASGQVLFLDPTWSQITWADLDAGESGLLVSNQGANTWAADIGPDDALYVGAWGCSDEISAQMLRFGDDGSREVYVDGLRGEVRDIAFAPDGGLYISVHDFDVGSISVYYLPPEGGDLVEVPDTDGYGIVSLTVDPLNGHLWASEHQGASILEFTLSGLVAEYPITLPKDAYDFHIDAAPDGTLYAYCSEAERATTGPVVERWVLELDPAAGTSEIVFQFDRQGCCVMGNLSADTEGALWWLVDPEMQIFRVTPTGEGTLFAQTLPCDPAAVEVDSQGDVYFTSPSGIYRIYEE